MTFEEFVARVASESPRTVERDVCVNSAEIWQQLRDRHARQGKPSPTFADFNQEQGRVIERRSFAYEHILDPPVSDTELAEWRARFPDVELPRDLLALLRKTNGIHLWADTEEGRSHFGLAPIREWTRACEYFYGDGGNDLLGSQYVAITYDTDHNYCIAYDAMRHCYWETDAIGGGPDVNDPIPNVAALLDCLWGQRAAP